MSANVAQVEQNSLTKGNLLGEGVFGKVWEVECLRFGNVVFKEFKEEVNRNEVKHMLNDTHHPNIVRSFAIVVDNNICRGYLMEKMECSLHTKIYEESQKYEEKMALGWIHDAALGLDHLHRKGITHFDVKPANMLLNNDKSVLKLCDLGLAKHYSSNSDWIGSLVYRAPETFDRLSKPGIKADVWSLGISIWEIYHRRSPYSKSDGTLPLIIQFLNGPPELKCEFPKGLTCSTYIEKLFFELKMLGRNPSERPFMDAVANYVNGLLKNCKESYIQAEIPLKKEIKKQSLGNQGSSSSSSNLWTTNQNSINLWLTTASHIIPYNLQEIALISKKSQEASDEIKKLNAKKTKESVIKCKNDVLELIEEILKAAQSYSTVTRQLFKQENSYVLEEMEKFQKQTKDIKHEFVIKANQKIKKLPQKKTK